MHLDYSAAPLRQLWIVRDDDQRSARRSLSGEQQVDDRRAGFAVQISGRLVGKDDPGPGRDGAGDRNALLLAARQLDWIMAEAVSKADRLELTPGAIECVFGSGEFERHRDIFKRGHGRKQMEGLKHDPDLAAASAGKRIFIKLAKGGPGDGYITSRRAFETGEHGHQRRFAGPRRAKNRDALTGSDFKGDSAKHVRPGIASPEGQGDIAHADDNIPLSYRMHERRPPPVVICLRYVALLCMVQLAAGCSSEKDGGANVASRADSDASTSAPAAAQQQERRLILAFGDSLYAGYGLDQGQSFPAVLERMLAERGVPAETVNAGVSGDTTAGGLRRLAFTLDGLDRKPDLAIVGLGANDMLRGFDPAETRQNLRAILEELKRRDIPVMLTGMAASRSLGADYVRRFEAIYPEVAREYGADLDPFFMADVITDRSLLLADGLHPNADGINAIARRLAPRVAVALERSNAR